MFFSPTSMKELQYQPLVFSVTQRNKMLVRFAAAQGLDVSRLAWATACATSRAFSFGNGLDAKAMVPFIDMANHSFEANAKLEAGKDAVRLVATSDISADEEVTISCTYTVVHLSRARRKSHQRPSTARLWLCRGISSIDVLRHQVPAADSLG
jgi:hypothetical protein